MGTRDLFLIISSIGAVQSLFWGLYLILFDKRSTSTRLLAGFFLVLAARIIKSTLWLFSSEVDLVILNLGFAAHLAIGPFLLLYLQSLQSAFKLKWVHYFHFIPALAVTALSTQLELNGFWYSGGYTILAAQSIAYLLVAGGWFFMKRKEINQGKNVWPTLLLVGTAVVLVAYFTNYISGPLFYAAVIYVFSFYLLKNLSTIFSKKEKYKNINLPEQRSQEYKLKIQSHFEDNKPYLDNDYTLTTLSEDLNIPKHLLSNVFSSQFQMSFTDFMNSRRVEIAKVKLVNEQHLTVSSVAYDCGFNTLSSFNQAFKKFTKTTPSRYRETAKVVI